MWRELQKDVLEELSALYSSVYSGDKLKNWPTIFMLACILLAVWEEMQFDSHYRTPVSWRRYLVFCTMDDWQVLRMRLPWISSALIWRPLLLVWSLVCSRRFRRSFPPSRIGRHRSITTCSTRILTCVPPCPRFANTSHNMVWDPETISWWKWFTNALTLQRATFGTVRTRPSTAVISTVYPTNSFPDLLFEQIKRQKIFFLIRGWRFITRAFGSQCDTTAARFDGMSTIYYERTYMRYADTFLMIMRRDYSHPVSECYHSFYAVLTMKLVFMRIRFLVSTLFFSATVFFFPPFIYFFLEF